MDRTVLLSLMDCLLEVMSGPAEVADSKLLLLTEEKQHHDKNGKWRRRLITGGQKDLTRKFTEIRDSAQHFPCLL